MLDSRELYQETGKETYKYNVSYSYKEEFRLDNRERYQERGERPITECKLQLDGGEQARQ